MFKKFTSLIMIIAFLMPLPCFASSEFTLAQSSIMAAERVDILTMPSGLVAWDGSTKTQPEGDGSESNPYKIANGAHLAWFSSKVSAGNTSSDDSNRKKCAVLVNDINMNGKAWQNLKICNQGYNYGGTFDGQGHTIYNLTIKKADKRAGGMFSIIGIEGGNATVKNINFVNAKSMWNTASGYTSDVPSVGILCGEARFPGTVIENIHILSGEITAVDTAAAEAVGSIAGRLKGGTIRNCTANVNIKLDNIVNTAESYTNEVNTLGVGGIAGTIENASTNTGISRCNFTGSINAPVSSRVGGIVGNIGKTANYSISDCGNTGSVTGYRQVGGVIGWDYDGSGATVAPERIYNRGDVKAKATSNPYAAGIANGIDFSLLTSSSYSVGDVSAEGGFDNTCAMLYTTLSTEIGKDNVYSIYKNSTNAPLSANGVHISSAENIVSMDEDEFTDGTAAEYLVSDEGKSIWYETNENAGYPISGANASKTYYVTNGSIKVTLDEEGIFPVTIVPVDESVNVTVGDDSRDITSSGVYNFSSYDINTEIYVEGGAKITLNLGRRKEKNVISNLSASKIKVSYKQDGIKTIVLAFYKGTRLVDIKYKTNVPAKLVDGEKYIFSTIDLSDKDLKGVTLKAFLWENNNLKNVSESSYVGRYNGIAASDEDKKAALSAVSEGYALKGASIQYDSKDITNTGEKRYTLFAKAPEDYTEGNPGYVDEDSLIYDIYYNAFGLKIHHPLSANGDLKELSGSMGDIGKKIETGDVLLAEGKKMLYLGDNKLIWAEGENYDEVQGKEKYEKYGAVKTGEISSISQSAQVTVLRPFTLYEAEPISDEIISRINNMKGITAEKLSSKVVGQTADLGDEITYNIRIENTNSEAVTLDVSDEISEYTTLISGCDNTNGNRLSWNVTVPANTAEEISYTVKVSDDKEAYNTYIDGSRAKVGGVSVPCYDVSIKTTLNEVDAKRVNTAIYALCDSEFEGETLLKMIYTVAFTRSASITGTPLEILETIYVTGGAGSADNATGEEVSSTVASLQKMVAPSLFGGKEVSKKAETVFGSERAYMPKKSALVTGDVLVTEKNGNGKMYIYNGEDFRELTKHEMLTYDSEEILESLILCDRYAVLRPSMIFTTLNHYKMGEKEPLTKTQEAAIKTAEAYLLRGARMQYDDTRFFDSGEYRWQKQQRHPEQYTTDEWGYSNCAAFTHDVYYHGLNYDIGPWNTSDLKGLFDSGSSMAIYSYEKTGTETEEEKKRIEEEIMSILQPADIIVVRREGGNSGHAMFYAGDETIIHSGGSNYDYNNSKETYEPTVRYKNVRDLFWLSGSYNIFGDSTGSVVKFFGIVRPLVKNKTVPEHTENRVDNLYMVKAEKLSSHPSLKTVNPGEEISYTFSVLNANDHDVTLDVTDKVPENTTYISGAETKSGDALSWKVTLSPGEKKEMTYKVRVNDGVPYDTLIGSKDGYVGGVPVNCPQIKVKRTLTKDEQATLKQVLEDMRGTTLTDIELANAVYKEVLGVDALLPGSEYADIISGLFVDTTAKSGYKVLATEGVYPEMVIPSMYGGRKFYSTRMEYKRVRLPRVNQLLPGDILVSRTTSYERLHMYNGETFVNLRSGLALDTVEASLRLEQLLAYGRDFAILRPTMVIE